MSVVAVTAPVDAGEVGSSTELQGACRLCSYDAFAKDDLGPVHLYWAELLGAAWVGRCPACVESRKAKRQSAARKVRR